MMCGPDPYQPPQPSSRALETGLPPYEPSLNYSTSSSSSLSSSSATPTSSLTAPPTSIPKKRKWYKPKLRVKLNADWIWVGLIRAGHTTPTGRGRSAIAKEVHEEWEQLPAYTPLAEGSRERMERSDEARRELHDDWLIEPPSTEPGSLRRDGAGDEPPAYQ
jgi:hypothetical protein